MQQAYYKILFQLFLIYILNLNKEVFYNKIVAP